MKNQRKMIENSYFCKKLRTRVNSVLESEGGLEYVADINCQHFSKPSCSEYNCTCPVYKRAKKYAQNLTRQQLAQSLPK